VSFDVNKPSVHGIIDTHRTWIKVLNESWEEELQSVNPNPVRLRVLVHTYMSIGKQILKAMDDYELHSYQTAIAEVNANSPRSHA